MVRCLLPDGKPHFIASPTPVTSACLVFKIYQALSLLRSRVQDLERESDDVRKKEPNSSSMHHSSCEAQDESRSAYDSTLRSHLDDVKDLAESLDTVSITEYGKSSIFWVLQEALSEHMFLRRQPRDFVLIRVGRVRLSCRGPGVDRRLPCSNTFTSVPEIVHWVTAGLPLQIEAWSHFKTFYENDAYLFIPLPSCVSWTGFIGFYGPIQGPILDIPRGHRLALSLIRVLAISELLDLRKLAIPTGENRFYHLERASLAVERLCEHPKLIVVQVMILMILYLNISDHKDSAECGYQGP